jgi:hypothetical protein
MLKSKELQEYFKNHQNEREILVESISKMGQTLSKYAIKCPGEVPDYLLPAYFLELRKKQE